MFEIGWTEMLVIAVVMIVVVGPKDLPKMLRTFGRTAGKLRAMAGDFQKQFNEALKEAELDDVKKSVDALRDLNPASQIRKSLNPFEQAAADVRAGLQTLKNPSTPPEPASPVAVASEPLKNGATAMPGEAPPAAPALAESPSSAATPPTNGAAAPAAVSPKPARKPAAARSSAPKSPAAKSLDPRPTKSAGTTAAKPAPAKRAAAPTAKAVPKAKKSAGSAP